jgi:pyruvate dehydrogenase E2 component (dihydrolipoamide acetyltransferase)
VEIISEKATYDLESPATGILRKILIEEGADAPVNAVLAIITASDETLTEQETLAEKPQLAQPSKKRVIASPAAKRLAKEYGINLSLVKGSGPEGRISEEDVRKFIEERKGLLPKTKEIFPLTGFKKISAERIATSFRTAPHSTLMMEVDISKASELRNKLQVSYTTIIVKAAAKALKEHSLINSTLEDNKIRIFEDINIGIAVAAPQGLIVPVIHNADQKSLKEINAAINELAQKARRGKLTKEDLSGGTFTITNLGMYNVSFFTPIINPPEAAILGVGKITQKPTIINGKMETKPLMILSLSYDHRIVDGAPAAQFLHRIKEHLENPETL